MVPRLQLPVATPELAVIVSLPAVWQQHRLQQAQLMVKAVRLLLPVVKRAAMICAAAQKELQLAAQFPCHLWLAHHMLQLEMTLLGSSTAAPVCTPPPSPVAASARRKLLRRRCTHQMFSSWSSSSSSSSSSHDMHRRSRHRRSSMSYNWTCRCSTPSSHTQHSLVCSSALQGAHLCCDTSAAPAAAAAAAATTQPAAAQQQQHPPTALTTTTCCQAMHGRLVQRLCASSRHSIASPAP